MSRIVYEPDPEVFGEKPTKKLSGNSHQRRLQRRAKAGKKDDWRKKQQEKKK